MKTVTLYRPVGETELLLIAESNFKSFPPRLEWQPIFYPVLNEEYASEIASKWNTEDEFGNYLGFVTEFKIQEEEFNKYKVQNVGGKIHDELWVPAEELNNFNSKIEGHIKVNKVYFGENFVNVKNEALLNYLYSELEKYKTILDTFLETKSKRILNFDYFETDWVEKKDVNKSSIEKFNSIQKRAQEINTISDAVTFFLDNCIKEKDLKALEDETIVKKLKNSSSDHFGINLLLRNLFFHNNHNNHFLTEIKNYEFQYGRNRGELNEGVLKDAIWRRVHNLEDTDIKKIKELKVITRDLREESAKLSKEMKINGSDLLGTSISQQQKDEILDKRFDEYIIHMKNYLTKKVGSFPMLRLELMSYNIDEKTIEKYIQIEDQIKNTQFDDQELIYNQKQILLDFNDKDRQTFIALKRNYFSLIKVIENLKK